MPATIRRLRLACFAVAIALSSGTPGQGQAAGQEREAKKPEITVRASPKIAFVPAKIQFTAALEGGDDDYRDFYCPTIEWEWGDDTTSESSPDCEPYEAGQSRIRRRYTAQHVYHLDGLYEVSFRLKSGGRRIAAATVTVEVRSGVPSVSAHSRPASTP